MLGDLHDPERQAGDKYRKLHRRQASGQVKTDASRGRASSKNMRSAVTADVFEDALARVSRSLSKAAKASAATLKADRLAMARSGSSAPAKPAAPGKSTGSGRRPAKNRPPAVKKRHATTLAKGQRRQAKRDSR